MASDQLPKNTLDLKPTLKGARPYFSVSIPQQLGVPCTQRHLRSCLLLYCYPFILIFVLCNYHESLLDAVYWQTFGPYEILCLRLASSFLGFLELSGDACQRMGSGDHAGAIQAAQPQAKACDHSECSSISAVLGSCPEP